MTPASNFENQVKVLKVSTDFNDALATHKENVEKAKQLAKEMNYNISESVEDHSFISINPDNPAGEHYNVWMISQQLSGEFISKAFRCTTAQSKLSIKWQDSKKKAHS